MSSPSTSALTQDQIEDLIFTMKHPKTGVKMRDVTWHMKTFKNCFSGHDMVNWIKESNNYNTREEAVEYGNRLLKSGVFHHVTSNLPLSDSELLYEFKKEPIDSIADADEIIKEYLIFRGFKKTYQAFETELKTDDLKSFQASRIIDQLFEYVRAHNLSKLEELWQHMERFFFIRLDATVLSTVRKMELSLKRYYVIYAINAGATDKVAEFFSMNSQQLTLDPEWKQWFVLPYLKNPEKDPVFEVYFSKKWFETFSLSFHNFLKTILSEQIPRILNFNHERAIRRSLENEISRLRSELSAYRAQNASSR